MGLDHEFRVSINSLFSGEKIIQGDQRHARYHGAFRPESHTTESFLASIQEGKAFCAELLQGECGREHHGQWCCKERREQGDSTHCGRPEGYRVGWHFQSSQVLALDVPEAHVDHGLLELAASQEAHHGAGQVAVSLRITRDEPSHRG